MRRHVDFLDSALDHFIQHTSPAASGDEREAVFTAIEDLADAPQLGVRLFLYRPGDRSVYYQIEVGRFRIIYTFTASNLHVHLIGC